ncbi:glutamate synthase, partial [Rhodanobacter sp. C05]
MSFNALLQPDVIGPALTANAPTTVNLGVGQIERLTFTGTAGQTVALNVSAESTTPAGQGVYVFVYQPGTITPTNYYTYVFTNGSANTLNLPNLPASGTYTLSVATPYGVPGTVQVTLASGVTGTLPSNGTSQSYVANTPGQNAYLSFTATAGQDLELELTNINVSGGSQNQVGVTVTNAAGTSIANISC